MTALDVFVFLLLFGSAAVGFVRGFVHEVISLFAWIVGVAMLKLFHGQLWTGLMNSFGWGSATAAVLAFAILFVPSFLIVKLLAASAVAALVAAGLSLLRLRAPRTQHRKEEGATILD